MSLIGGCKDCNGVKILTLTRVRITIADSNTAFTGVASMVFLKAARVSMSVLSIVVIVEWDSTSPTAQGWEVVVIRDGGRQGIGNKTTTVGGRIVGHGAYMRPTYSILQGCPPLPETSRPTWWVDIELKWLSIGGPSVSGNEGGIA